MNRTAFQRRWPWVAGAGLVALVLLLRYGNTVAIALENPLPSQSLGTPARGELRNGKRLPSRGENFRAYSDLGALLGRNAVHHKENGVNILLYGPPGTGKTELAKVVAQAAGLELFEVEYADRDGNSGQAHDV